METGDLAQGVADTGRVRIGIVIQKPPSAKLRGSSLGGLDRGILRNRA